MSDSGADACYVSSNCSFLPCILETLCGKINMMFRLQEVVVRCGVKENVL